MKRTLILFFIACLLGVIAACGGSESKPTEPPPVPTTQAPPAQPTATTAPTSMPVATAAIKQTVSPSQTTNTQRVVSPLAAPSSPLAAPVSPLATPTKPLTTTATTGTVTGRLMFNGKQGIQPVTGAIIGLGVIMKGDKNTPDVVRYEASKAPRENLDNLGNFVIYNVPPGTYGLMLDTGPNAYLLNDPEDLHKGMIIQVKGGEVLNLKVLMYNSLPLTGYAK